MTCWSDSERTLNQRVAGSSPARFTIFKRKLRQFQMNSWICRFLFVIILGTDAAVDTLTLIAGFTFTILLALSFGTAVPS